MPNDLQKRHLDAGGAVCTRCTVACVGTRLGGADEMLLETEEILVGIILPVDMDGTESGAPKGDTISVA